MLITAPIADGRRQSHQLPVAGILGPLLGSSCPGTRYLYAIVGVGLEKIDLSTNFCPVPLDSTGGAHPTVGGTSIPN